MAGGGPRPPTQVVNPDGSTTTTQYADDGSATVKSTYTLVTNPDGSKTETRRDPAGSPITITYKDASGRTVKSVSANNPQGNVYVTDFAKDGGGTTSIYGPDGKTPISTKVSAADGSTTTTSYNQDGTPQPPVARTPAEEIAANNAAVQADFDANKTLNADGSSRLYGNSLLGVIGNDIKGAGTGLKGFLNDTKVGNVVKAVGNTFTLGGLNALVGPDAKPTIKPTTLPHTGTLPSSVVTGSAPTGGPGATGNGAGAGAAPTTSSSRTITAAQAKDPALVTYLAQQPITSATAGQVGAIPQVVAPTIDMANAPRSVAGVATAGTATAAQAQAYLAQAAQAQAAQAEASKAEASLATASQLDATKQAEFRDTQKQLVGYLNDAIAGKSPSVAELQLRDAEQRQEANQLGLAAAASRGGNSALAMRTAANNIARLNQGASADQALLRAKEIADARGQLGTAAEQGRGADINLADRNATLTTGVSQSNAGLLTGVSQSNAGLATGVSQSNAGLRTGVSQSNAGLLTDVSNANAGRQTSVSQSNAGLQTDVSKTNATNQTSASNTNATNTTSANNTNANNLSQLLAKQAELQYNASHDNAGNALSAQETQAKINTDVSLASALAKNTSDLQNQRLSQESSAANARNSVDVNINNTKFLNDAAAANAANQLTAERQAEQARQDAAANALTSRGQDLTSAAEKARIQAAKDALDWKKTTDVADAGAAAVSWLTGGKPPSFSGGTPAITPSSSTIPQSDYDDGEDDGTHNTQPPTDEGTGDYVDGSDSDWSDNDDLVSDRRLKTDVKDGTAGAQALLDTLTAKSFRYKDGGNAPGERPGSITGIMAQDLEKTKAGKPLVINTPRGKAIDVVPAMGTTMAMLAAMNKRLDRMEGRRNV